MKGMSDIFASLIVTIVILSLAIPLYSYFYFYTREQQHLLANSYSHQLSQLTTDVSVIKLGPVTSQIYVYNYGNSYALLQEVILGNKTFDANVWLPPDGIRSIYNVTDQDLYVGNGSIVVKVNGNLFFY